MKKIGLFEAKAKLSELCLKVEEGQEIYVITRRGKAIAQLVPVAKEEKPKGKGILKELDSFRKKHGAPGGPKDDFPEVWKERSRSSKGLFEGE